MAASPHSTRFAVATVAAIGTSVAGLYVAGKQTKRDQGPKSAHGDSIPGVDEKSHMSSKEVRHEMHKRPSMPGGVPK
ncbi:hypothetical protein OF83DRAFT_1167202 [Amylostereum chailletii]|nr:hypothetical protein OF83DRAFT_1167202 [Amylostereum chailletii]